ncbi:hypothetical protein ACFQ10_02635 [Streptomyces indonesiensis]
MATPETRSHSHRHSTNHTPAAQMALTTVAPRSGYQEGASGGRITLAKSSSTVCHANVNSTAPHSG